MRWYLGLLAFLAAARFASAQSFSFPIENIRVGFPHGNEDRYTVGKWAPVSFELGLPPKFFTPRLEYVIETEDGDGTRARSAPIPIPDDKNGVPRRTNVGYVKIGSLDGRIRVHLQGTHAGEAVRETATYDPYAHALALDPARTLVVCIGQPAGFDHLQPSDPTDPAWRVAFADVGRLPVGRLPDQWLGYDAVDIVVLPTGVGEELDLLRDHGEKLLALERWVQMGGHLVVSVSKNSAKLRDFPTLERMLPAEIDPTRSEPRTLDNLGSFVRTRVRGATDKTFAPPLVRLKPKPSGRSVSSESDPLTEGPPVPVAVQTPYGLGSVTLLAFDTDVGPFTTWEGRRDFWVALLKLRTDAGPTQRSLASRLRPEDEDLAARLCTRLERFPDIRIIPFLWISLLMAGYLVLVGPVDYLFLKRALRRMHFTWITFPIVAVLACSAAFMAARQVKGTELRVNKVDLVEIDWAGRQVYGSTWLTLYSPSFQSFDIGLQPVGLGSRLDAGAFGWMGRPGGGMRGLAQTQRIGTIGPASGDAYQYSVLPTGTEPLRLDGVAVGQWAAKTLTARWNTPVDMESQRLDVRLRSRGYNLEGHFTWDLPWTLENCRLVYRDQGWEIGTLKPRDVCAGDRLGEPIPLRKLAEREEAARNPAAARDSFLPLFREMMLHKAVSGGRGAPSYYLDYLDQSWRLDFASQAMLIGQARDAEGPAAEITATTDLGTRLQLARPGLSGRIRQCTIVRVFLPVTN